MSLPTSDPSIIRIQEYPYPSHVSAPNFVTVKLSGRDVYNAWKTQMLCLLESHVMLGFIDGTFVSSPQSSLWRRSDSLVKGWILGSICEQAIRNVLDSLQLKCNEQTLDFTAKNIWDEVQSMYGSAVVQQAADQNEERMQVYYSKAKDTGRDQMKDATERTNYVHQLLYRAVESGIWDDVDYILKSKKVKTTDRISINGNTALHLAVAASTTKKRFLERMLEQEPNCELLDVRNSDGSTVLHVAALLGNTDAAKILVERNRGLLFAKDNHGCTPLDIAPSDLKHRDTYLFLLVSTMPDAEANTIADEKALLSAISCRNFDLALELIRRYNCVFKSDVVLRAIAQSYPTHISLFDSIIYELWHAPILEFVIRFPYVDILEYKGTLEHKKVAVANLFFRVALAWPFKVFIQICMKLRIKVFMSIKKRMRRLLAARDLLDRVCVSIKDSNDSSSHHHYYSKPILEAVRRDADRLVNRIMFWFPDAIKSIDEDGHNIAQAAMKNRSLRVGAMITPHAEMSKHTNMSQKMKDDPCGNNFLHFAARLAPAGKLNRISGPALQMQRELQCFKIAKTFAPAFMVEKNCFGETPDMVFTKEHKELVNNGEKWIKDTASSCIVTATLITTIVFAAAITVPGGNDENSGIPILAKRNTFKIFAISDMMSMFTSAASLLLFLSIFTSRFAEEDFFLKLPLTMLAGFISLFISATFMIAAFGYTLLIMLGQTNPWIIGLVIPLAWLPISCFLFYLKSLVELTYTLLLMRIYEFPGRTVINELFI